MLAALSQGSGHGLAGRPAQALLVSYGVAMTLGYAAAWLASFWNDPHGQLFHLNAISFGAATAVSAGAIAIGLFLAGSVDVNDQRAQVVAVLGPLWLLGSLGLHSAVFVGLRRDSPLFDLDREWLARLSALKLRAGALWGVLAFASLSLTWLLNQHGTPPTKVTAPAILALGSLAAWIGKQASTNAGAIVGVIQSSQRWRALTLNLLCGVFILGLIAVLGMIADRILGWSQQELGAHFPSLVAARPSWRLLIIDVAAIGLLLCVIVWVTQRVNVNRYSMHAVYRNRLTRAFLGPARGPARQPDPFTNLASGRQFPARLACRRDGPAHVVPGHQPDAEHDRGRSDRVERAQGDGVHRDAGRVRRAAAAGGHGTTVARCRPPGCLRDHPCLCGAGKRGCGPEDGAWTFARDRHDHLRRGGQARTGGIIPRG